jgi:acetoin:2,6-dichlorophenolindophenol oxidoreductase subunit alpha
VTAALYRTMLTTRLLEARLLEMCKAGEAGDLHFNKGQEAIATGVCAALRPTDRVVTHHRTIGHAVAKGWDIYKLVAEILGKRTGQNGGRAGEMHLSNHAVGHEFSFQLVGTCLPVAVGLAWALRKQGSQDIVACFFGDAATSNGAFHEACTIAAIHKVPLLLVCENNGRAGNVTKDHYLPVPTVSGRMSGYGIPAKTIDGNDVEWVRKQTELRREEVREYGPFLLECLTERGSPHKIGQGDLRSKEEMARVAALDPLPREEARLMLTDVEVGVMRAEISLELDAVFARVALDPVAEVNGA